MDVSEAACRAALTPSGARGDVDWTGAPSRLKSLGVEENARFVCMGSCLKRPLVLFTPPRMRVAKQGRSMAAVLALANMRDVVGLKCGYGEEFKIRL